MRLAFAVLLVMGWSVGATAQSTLAPVPALPPIGLPLPDITAPLAPVGLPPATTGFEKPPAIHRPEKNPPRSRRRPPHQPAVVYVLDSYFWTAPHGARSATPGVIADVTPSVATPAVGSGTLRLEIIPAGSELQVYVDGSFVGTADDLDSAVDLPAGRHTIELRAPGYEALAFDANITAGRTITYSGALERRLGEPPVSQPSVVPGPSGSEPAAAPSTFYYIPGCYMGNIPPSDIVLPPTCDRTKMITRTP